MAHTHKARNYGSALGFMTLGTSLVLGAVVLINAYNKGPDKEEVQDTAQFNVAPPEPPPQEKTEPEPKPEPKQQPNNPPPSPLKGLGTSVGAGSFAISSPDFNADGGGLDDSVLGNTKDVVMTDDSVDVPPKPAQRTPMKYPPEARQKGITGYVTVNLLINAQGQVEKVKVLESQPGGVFEDAAVKAVRGWRFEPAEYEGESVKVWAKQKIRFNLS